jgi:hypothetical protein
MRRRLVGMNRDSVFACLAAGTFAVVVGATPSFAVQTTASNHPLRISAAHVAGVALGTGRTASLRKLNAVLGQPRHREFSNGHVPKGQRHCAFTGEVDWEHFNAFFYRDRLVGYAVWARRLRTRSGHTSPVASSRGLRVGNTLRRARARYGRVVRSSAQGGSWAVSTRGGRLLGYSQAARLGSPILSIEAGHVGCTALAPQP